MTLPALPVYEQHPIAIQLMPGGMDETEFKAFCADIQERGILFPVTLFEGKVLDGWHRYRAGHKTGTHFKTIEYKGTDPAGYIAACNILRRKLSSLQRALVGARMHRDHGHTQRDVCAKLGTSNEVVNLVLKAMDSNSAKLLKRIENDADFTRSMLREELEDAGVQKPRVQANPATPNSVFALGDKSDREFGQPHHGHDDDAEDLLGGQPSDTSGIGPVGAGAGPLPEVGKKPGHAERRAKATAAQNLQQGFKALMYDEKVSFLNMIWPEAQPILAEQGMIVPTAKQIAAGLKVDASPTPDTPAGKAPSDAKKAPAGSAKAGKPAKLAAWDQPKKPAKPKKPGKA